MLMTLLFCALIAPALNAANGYFREKPSTLHRYSNIGQVRTKRQLWELTTANSGSPDIEIDNRGKQKDEMEQPQNNNDGKISVSKIYFDSTKQGQDYNRPPPPLRHRPPPPSSHWGSYYDQYKRPPPPPYDGMYPRRPGPPYPYDNHRTRPPSPSNFHHGHGPPHPHREYRSWPPPPFPHHGPPNFGHRPPPWPHYDRGPPHYSRGPPHHHRGPPPPFLNRGFPPHDRRPPPPPPYEHYDPPKYRPSNDHQPPQNSQGFPTDNRPQDHRNLPQGQILSTNDNRPPQQQFPNLDTLSPNKDELLSIPSNQVTDSQNNKQDYNLPSTDYDNADLLRNLKLVFSDDFKNTVLKNKPESSNNDNTETAESQYKQKRGEPLANFESSGATPPSAPHIFQVVPVTPEN